MCVWCSVTRFPANTRRFLTFCPRDLQRKYRKKGKCARTVYFSELSHTEESDSIQVGLMLSVCVVKCISEPRLRYEIYIKNTREVVCVRRFFFYSDSRPPVRTIRASVFFVRQSSKQEGKKTFQVRFFPAKMGLNSGEPSTRTTHALPCLHTQ